MSDEALIFQERYEDGRKRLYALNPWPETIRVSHDLLLGADPAYVTNGDGMLRFTLENGSALYGFVEELEYDIDRWKLLEVSA